MGRVRQVSVRYLADTHVLLWGLHADPRLRPRHAEILQSDSSIFASFVSLWEVSIKVGLGKLQTVEDFPGALEAAGFEFLPLALSHIDTVRKLPRHHGDPFDRMLIAQARLEGLTILTIDRAFRDYDVAVA